MENLHTTHTHTYMPHTSKIPTLFTLNTRKCKAISIVTKGKSVALWGADKKGSAGLGGVTKGHNKPWAMMDEPIVLSMTTVSGCTRHGQTYQSIQFIARSLNLKSSHAKNPSKVLHCFPSKTPRDLVVWHNLGPTYLCNVIVHHFHTSNSLPKHTQPFPAPGHLNVSPCPERSFSSTDLSAFSKSQVRNHRAISWCPGLEAGSSQVASPAIALCIYPSCRDYPTDSVVIGSMVYYSSPCENESSLRARIYSYSCPWT